MDQLGQIAAHRERIADLIESLDADQLSTPSLCEGWTVQEVAGHLTSLWNVRMPSFVWRVFRSGFDLHAASLAVGQELGARPVAEIAEDLRSNARNKRTPPAAGLEVPLSDAWIHALDMCVPLGITYDVDIADVMAIVDTMVDERSRPARANDFDARFTWRATDTDWSHVNGDEHAFSGPMHAIVLAFYGRGDALGLLQGPVHLL